MISVLTVSYKAPEFLDLLVRSVRAFTHGEHEILVHHNGGPCPEMPDAVTVFDLGKNIGHGRGLDALLPHAKGDRILILDVDAHMLLPDWDLTVERVRENDGFDMIAPPGPALKPIRPAFCYMTRECLEKGKLSFIPREVEGASFDVGILAYFQALTAGQKVGFTAPAKNPYPGSWGEAYAVGGQAVCYHHWYGSRFNNGLHKIIDGRRLENMEASKEIVIRDSAWIGAPAST